MVSLQKLRYIHLEYIFTRLILFYGFFPPERIIDMANPKVI